MPGGALRAVLGDTESLLARAPVGECETGGEEAGAAVEVAAVDADPEPPEVPGRDEDPAAEGDNKGADSLGGRLCACKGGARVSTAPLEPTDLASKEGLRILIFAIPADR